MAQEVVSSLIPKKGAGVLAELDRMLGPLKLEPKAVTDAGEGEELDPVAKQRQHSKGEER